VKTGSVDIRDLMFRFIMKNQNNPPGEMFSIIRKISVTEM